MYAHIQGIVERQEGVLGIRLYVDKRNTAANEVYRRLGMDGEHYAMFEWMP
jgi:ribosomal protein S18 acetylase RimI-like enzyme